MISSKPAIENKNQKKNYREKATNMLLQVVIQRERDRSPIVGGEWQVRGGAEK